MLPKTTITLTYSCWFSSFIIYAISVYTPNCSTSSACVGSTALLIILLLPSVNSLLKSSTSPCVSIPLASIAAFTSSSSPLLNNPRTFTNIFLISFPNPIRLIHHFSITFDSIKYTLIRYSLLYSNAAPIIPIIASFVFLISPRSSTLSIRCPISSNITNTSCWLHCFTS
ncbi:hypothetical protein AX774_g4448 [Zancudomyces culisetae]|uniref:Uncharacterized protein n=1 Tax=Zancudomyces culisetae TaxID=1213189 RepID=A0A1R1PMC7_ZANCU|nr:hypothetical protein AX774_g4448 [Zancudomyces culisetae]|eukprot:OMH82089.1 hypothetical protein AX774_g4448 [Zancudomyces culisetae]